MHVARRFRGILPVTVLLIIASTTTAQYSGGSGTAADPYQIATAADLIALGETPNDYDKHFILTADIDLDPNLPAGRVFDRAVIAPDLDDVTTTHQGVDFTGVFDGNDHTISHLTIAGRNQLGLFGQLGSGARVSNLGMEAVDVHGCQNIGALAGSLGDWNTRDGILDNCYSTGTVRGSSRVGGLVGSNYDGTITACYSTGTVSGDRSRVGGLVGSNHGGSITTSYSACAVHGDGDVGGLVGSTSDGTITTSYSSGAVTGDIGVGGFVGRNGASSITTCYSSGAVRGSHYYAAFAGTNSHEGSIITCYSSGAVSGGEGPVGGFVGRGSRGVVCSSVWDVQTSGLTVSNGGVGLTTAEMMDSHMLGLNGFADDPNWTLDAGRDYPRLAWEGAAGQIIPEPIIDWLDGQGTEEGPYCVDTAEQLMLLGKASVLWDKHFVLGADIDLDPSLPNRRALRQALIQIFTGVFDGCAHKISNLTIEGGGYLGLFGQLQSTAEVKNLGVVDANIAGSNRVGGLAGNNAGSIAMSYSTGTVTGESLYVGGLVGNNAGSIATSYSTVTVTGREVVGGIAGQNHGSITNSYYTGTVRGDTPVGGLVGYMYMGSIANCYSTGMVSGNWYDGGLVHRHRGDPNGVIGSFWDSESSGQITSRGGIGLTTAEMQTATTFLDAGWDFIDETENGTDDIWWILEGQDYPRLWWELLSDDAVVFVVDDFESYDDDIDRGTAIFETWIDSFDEVLPNGGMVGHILPPFAEQTIVHSGLQSMPFYYDNTGGVVNSRADRYLHPAQDWTAADAVALALWFRGVADNEVGAFYIAVNDKTVFHPDPHAVLVNTWTPWIIPLSRLEAAGVNTKRVTSMRIGVGDRTQPSQNARGILYIDDIRVVKRVQ